jgi:hypothetical protein
MTGAVEVLPQNRAEMLVKGIKAEAKQKFPGSSLWDLNSMAVGTLSHLAEQASQGNQWARDQITYYIQLGEETNG